MAWTVASVPTLYPPPAIVAVPAPIVPARPGAPALLPFRATPGLYPILQSTPARSPLPAPRSNQDAAFRGKYYHDARGLYRVFNAAEFRFYRDNSAPPEEGDTPFASNASLPFTPTDTFGDGTWYLSVSWFNGVLDSGFLPLGDRGETYLQLVISAGAEQENPPPGPLRSHLEVRAGGVVRVHAFLFSEALPSEWCIAYTTNGADPPEDTPDDTETIAAAAGLAILQYDLPAQSHGTTVKVRVQTRNAGPIYSDDSIVLTVTADATGPTAPLDGQRWPGPLPLDLE